MCSHCFLSSWKASHRNSVHRPCLGGIYFFVIAGRSDSYEKYAAMLVHAWLARQECHIWFRSQLAEPHSETRPGDTMGWVFGSDGNRLNTIKCI